MIPLRARRRTRRGRIRLAPDKPQSRGTQRKGEITKRRIHRDFPHQVAILIPVGGLVARLMAMHKFCDTRSMPYKTHADLRHDPLAEFVRFCFAVSEHADAFIAEFGGERITIEPH